MKIGKIDLEKKILIIAEIGNNHEGSYTLAEELIGLAAEAGADAVKFQTIIPERLISSSEQDRLRQLKKFQLSFNEFERLANFSKQQAILFLSTPFDLKSVEFLNELVPAFKVASGDNTFYPLLEAVCKTGKPIIMSCGLATGSELTRSVHFIESCWNKKKTHGNLALLHCVTKYPVPPEEANLSAITVLKQKFNRVIGYSDHTIGTEAVLLAIALGARIIEKHFTKDKNYSEFHDHKISADPAEFKLMVEKVQLALQLLKNVKHENQKREDEMRNQARRSIAASRNISKGNIISRDDIMWVRPGTGIPPGYEKQVLGKKLNRDIKAGELITMNKLD